MPAGTGVAGTLLLLLIAASPGGAATIGSSNGFGRRPHDHGAWGARNADGGNAGLAVRMPDDDVALVALCADE